MRFSRKSIAVVAAGLLAVGGTGIAWANWNASGIGTGSAKAVTAKAITVSADSPTAGLYPGVTKQPIVFKLSNPNPYPVTMTSVSYGLVTSSGGTASDVTVDSAAPTTVSFVLPAGATDVSEIIPDVLNMSSTADNADQGQTFSIAITLSGANS